MSILIVSLITAESSSAEIKTITATGEYRMGDNDTRTDAKRLALLDAKRLALEQAGTYLESVTEIKSLQVARDELNAYTAGIVEVTELETKDVLDGATHIIRVQVTAKIDREVVARQIDTLRKNETVKKELVRVQAESDQLRQKVAAMNWALATMQSKAEIEAAQQPLREALNKLEADELRARAWHLLEEKNITAARRLAEQALALNPSSPRVRKLMGAILIDEGHYEAAVHEFRAAVRLDPDDALVYISLGNVLARTGDKAGALEAFRTFHRFREPGDEVIIDSEAHLSLGAALERTGDWAGAIAAYRAAVRLWPGLGDAHRSLGFALAETGDWAGALEALRTSVRLRPDDVLAHFTLGEALQKTGRAKEAAKEFREVVRLASDEPVYRYWTNEARAALRELER